MITELEKFQSGRHRLGIAFTQSEIDSLISRLTDLKTGRIGHFHCRTLLHSSAELSKLFDIEFSLTGESDCAHHDMEVE